MCPRRATIGCQGGQQCKHQPVAVNRGALCELGGTTIRSSITPFGGFEVEVMDFPTARTGSSRDKRRAGIQERSNRVRNKQEETPPLRTGSCRDKWRRTPRTATSGAEQATGVASPPTGASREKRRKTPRIRSSGAKQEGEATTPGTRTAGEKGPDAQRRMVQGGSSRRSPRHLDWSGSNTKDHAREEHRSRAEEEAGETQTSKEVAGPRGS